MVPEAKLIRLRGVPAATSAPAMSSDEALLDALSRREPGAASALYDKLLSVVERTLYRILQRRGSDFEDLVQTTFERIVRTLVQRRFAANCKLTTWAGAIATNVAIDSVRARIRERRLFSPEEAGVLEHHPDRLGTNERMEVRAEVVRVQEVLGSMNPEQVQAVLLHDVLGHNLVEMAEIAGVSVAAVQSRLVRGRKEFLRRARLGERGEQGA